MDNSVYSFASPRHQKFSLPFVFLRYVMENCNTPELFQKLLQTCKLFFLKNKVIISKDKYITDSFILSKKSNSTKKFKYWLTGEFMIIPFYQKPIKYIYRCNLHTLNIYFETLTLNEISLLLNGGNIKDLFLRDVHIQNDDGTPVTIDAIMKQCPKLEKLNYENLCEAFSNGSFENLIKLKMFQNLKKFVLKVSKIDGEIDAYIFSEFIKKHFTQTKKAKVFFECIFPGFFYFHLNVKNYLGPFCNKLNLWSL